MLMLIDAMALVYRAFHAIPPLNTAEGVPTNALLGFVKTLTQLEQAFHPSHRLVVFDGGIPHERRVLLPDYKAQRPPMPDAMRPQLPLISEYLRHAGVASVCRDRQEADDVLASMAAAAEQGGHDVLVVTADKDLMQIVTDRTTLLTPGRIDKKIGPPEVLARAGVRPDQIVDWLALTGDSSDNINGLPGVGPKTAARWLGQWGHLEGILAHQAELSPDKCRRALVEGCALVERNRRLVALRRDLPGLPAPEDCAACPPDYGALLAFCRQYELHALARTLSAPELF